VGGRRARAVERGESVPVGAVGLVFETVDLHAAIEDLGRTLESREQVNRLRHGFGALHEDLREVLGVFLRGLDLEEHDALAHRLGQIEHVIHRRDEAADVGAVERRDPRFVEARDGVVRDLVALVLEIADPLGELARLLDVREDVREQLGRVDQTRHVLLEGFVEGTVALFRTDHGSPKGGRACGG
jgi:hypothetical protein